MEKPINYNNVYKALSLPLTKLTNLSSELGDFIEYRKLKQSINYFFYIIFFTNHWRLFMKFVLWSKTNKGMSTETFPPLLFKPPYMSVYAHVQCREPEKGQQKVRILKKTIWLCLSRSYSSISQPLPLHPAGCGAYAASPGVSLLRRYSTVCRHLFKSDSCTKFVFISD